MNIEVLTYKTTNIYFSSNILVKVPYANIKRLTLKVVNRRAACQKFVVALKLRAGSSSARLINKLSQVRLAREFTLLTPFSKVHGQYQVFRKELTENYQHGGL